MREEGEERLGEHTTVNLLLKTDPFKSCLTHSNVYAWRHVYVGLEFFSFSNVDVYTIVYVMKAGTQTRKYMHKDKTVSKKKLAETRQARTSQVWTRLDHGREERSSMCIRRQTQKDRDADSISSLLSLREEAEETLKTN